MTESQKPYSTQQLNFAGLSRADYRGAQSTLCQGCGHNSIASQIIAACYELGLKPEKVVKFSGIGCSSKSPTYFLSRSFGFNGLHGRMPSLALGGCFGDTSLKGIGISGDGDTASIGLGQFKHLVRRNLPLVYIVENNGVYGLTKGQFSATAERGLKLKKQGTNPYLPVDICHGGAGRQCHLRGAFLRRRPQAGQGIDQGGLQPQGHRRDRHHQPVRDLQQPGRHHPFVHLRQGPRGSAARDLLRAGAG